MPVQVVNRLSGQQLAAIFHLSPSRISETLAEARRKLRDETRQALASRLRVSPQVARSIIEALRSRIDLSVERLLVAPRTSRP